MFRRWIRRSMVTVVATAALSGSPTSVRCQSLWIPRDRGAAVTLEVLHPSIEDVETNLLATAWYLSARIPLKGSGTVFVAEIPFAHYSGDPIFGYPESSTGNMVGNIYAGTEVGPGHPLFGELGLRIPVPEGNLPALFVGLVSDVSRWEAFLGHRMALEAAANVRTKTDSGITARLRLAPTLWLGTDTEDTEAFALYACQIGFESRVVRVGGALAGRLLLTQKDYDLGERTDNEIELSADFTPWSVRPGIDMHFPLGEDASLVPFVLGARLSYVP